MAAPYTKAQLHTMITAVIGSMTAPESITPTTLDQLLDDIVDSFWNLLDNPGLDNPNANSQGLPGEFVACVADCAPQIVEDSVDTIINFPDDNANGSFDNGNNFLLSKYVTPAAGFTGKLTVSGLALNLSIANINPGGTFQVDIQIVKNRLTAAVVLATATIGVYDDTSVQDEKKFLQDLPAGTDAVPIVLIPGDTVEVVADPSASGANAAKVQIISGLFTAQKV